MTETVTVPELSLEEAGELLLGELRKAFTKPEEVLTLEVRPALHFMGHACNRVDDSLEILMRDRIGAIGRKQIVADLQRHGNLDSTIRRLREFFGRAHAHPSESWNRLMVLREEVHTLKRILTGALPAGELAGFHERLQNHLTRTFPDWKGTPTRAVHYHAIRELFAAEIMRRVAGLGAAAPRVERKKR